MKLRDYQIDLVDKAFDIVSKHSFVYLALEVRVGKTIISLSVADRLKAKNVLFITKKKAISSILKDFNNAGFNYNLVVINYESVHKVDGSFDVVIVDEAHSLGAFPKPSQRTKNISNVIGNAFVLFLSGTPTPESYSQFYHQFFILGRRSPFSQFRNFYRWADVFVKKEIIQLNGRTITKYNNANFKLIEPYVKPYILTFTQKQAGFASEVSENILFVKQDDFIAYLLRNLKKNNYICINHNGKTYEVTCDSPTTKMSKYHQICSGTVITDDGSYLVLSYAKALKIKETFAGAKIAIFYVYQAEFNAIADVFGYDNITSDPMVFNSRDDKIFVSQVKAGANGINISSADYLLFYNINFSAETYWQARARIQNIDRVESKVVWVFSTDGFEQEIYNTVLDKKTFTTKHFRAFNVRENFTKENFELFKS